MKNMNKRLTVVGLIVSVVIAVLLNFPKYLMGGVCTYREFITSIIYISVWLGLSYYWGKQGSKGYLKFIVSYWGVYMIFTLIVSIVIDRVDFNLIWVVPGAILFDCPLYGFKLLLTRKYMGILPFAGLVINSGAYFIGK